MRVYLNKKLVKSFFVVVMVIAVVLALLKLVSIWDSKQGAFNTENIKSQAQPSDDSKVRAPDVSVREPRTEEREMLATGSLTKDELIQALVNDAVVLLPGKSAHDVESSYIPADTQEDNDQPTQPVQSEYERRMAEIIAEAYVYRDEYIVTLDSMYAEAEGAFVELSRKENNGEEIRSLVNSYLSRASALEAQCDEKINTLVAEMEKLISDNNGDKSLIDKLIKTYSTEKAAKKASYIERLKEKVLS